MLLRKKGVRAGGAAAITEISMILVLAGIISLTGVLILRGLCPWRISGAGLPAAD